MGIEKKDLGKKGEKLARKFLKKKKCKILSTNFDRASGEIDIVALDGQTIVFVEVKTVSGNSPITPEEHISLHQKKSAVKSALSFIRQKSLQEYPLRMDFLGITFDGDKPSINHVPNYFSPAEVMPGLTI